MEIERLTENNKDEWNTFCLQSNDAWFRHTTYWMDYIMCCRFDSNSKNHSFLVRQNKEIVAVVPLISQYCYASREINEFANYDTPTPYWAFKNDNKNINKYELNKYIHAEIMRIASEYNVKRVSFFIDPLIESNYFDDFECYNLLKYGHDCKTGTTNMIDLTLPEDIILSEMRKGHKSGIKRILKDTDIRIDYVDRSSKNISILSNEYKKIHSFDAGRQTRTDASWACMENWICDKNGFLVLAWSKSEKKYICGAFVICYKSGAYYGSYATLDSLSNNALLGHLIQWSIITYLKSTNAEKYETGVNHYALVSEREHNKKLMEISKFKKGFGGKERVRIEYITPPPNKILIFFFLQLLLLYTVERRQRYGN
jgi:hypothetical protein